MEKPIGIKYSQAISAINPNWSGTISGNTESELVIDWNGQAEISVADIQAKITEIEITEQQVQAQKKADALAGNNKLLELGLTQAQVTAMTGYTPPVAE
jgi:hypothetical protein